MGQRISLVSSNQKVPVRPSDSSVECDFSIFNTDFGWCGLVGQKRKPSPIISALWIGHLEPDAVRATAEQRFASGEMTVLIRESDWWPELRRRLQRYFQGTFVDFSDCLVRFSRLTPFQQRVVEATRGIPYGGTLSYRELAEQAGSPGAARAVGNVMARNPVPIIIPCHRVVAAGGRLGGFSAPQGIVLKKKLLEMESSPAMPRR